jgi:NADP-dependent 3-hydroxy acid dehydrogenase YdfG
MVDTAFFDQPEPDALRPEDVARMVMFAVSQPAHVELHELMVLPTPPQDS